MRIPLNTIGIAGIGLLGGSIAKSCKKNKLCREIIGFGKNKEKLQKAKKEGIIDIGLAFDELYNEQILSRLDLLILATPVSIIETIIQKLFTMDLGKSQNLTITDVGSTKNDICQRAWATGNGARFIGSHPMAGKEKSGFAHADENLYQNATIFICPVRNHLKKKSKLSNLEKFHMGKVVNFWRSLGGNTSIIDPNLHDNIVARTSHLPHILSSALIILLAKNFKRDLFLEKKRWFGRGLLDFTRIAKGSPDMWSDILEKNTEPIADALKSYIDELNSLLFLIRNSSKSEIHAYLKRSVKLREKLN